MDANNPRQDSIDACEARGASAQDGFRQMLERHRGIVLKVAHTYCRHSEDRRDLEQEIVTQLWRAWPSYDPQRSRTTWMYRIALNVAISHVRRRARYDRHHVDVDTETLQHVADPSVAARERRHQLEQVLERLDPMPRALLLLYLEDRSQREIAEVLGISESNVGTRLNRLRKRLRDAFDEPPSFP